MSKHVVTKLLELALSQAGSVSPCPWPACCTSPAPGPGWVPDLWQESGAGGREEGRAQAEAAFLASWCEDTRSWQGGRRLRKGAASTSPVTRPACPARVATSSWEQAHWGMQCPVLTAAAWSLLQPDQRRHLSESLFQPSGRNDAILCVRVINVMRCTEGVYARWPLVQWAHSH